MKMPADAVHTLDALIKLLKVNAGFEIDARVMCPDADGASHRPELLVEFTGPDTPLLTAQNGELLHAVEHIAAKLLGLEPEDHDRISFDADNFKSNRDREIHRIACDAIDMVRATSTAYNFPPMMSRERRLLHLALAPSGLKSMSTGERFHRSVVLYPEGVLPPVEREPSRNGDRSR